MGKRELFIILGFAVAGIVAYQLTAPPAEDTGRGFSLSNFVSSMRREIRGNRSTASVTTTGVIALGDGLTELRLANFTRVKVTGESRGDIGYELTVESNGPDENAAHENAGRVTLVQDVVGPVLALRPTSARNLRQVTSMSLLVPSRVAIRVSGTQGGARLEATKVGAVQLDAVLGDVRLSEVNGSVTGSHRNGELVLSNAGTVNLTLVSTKANIENVRGPLTLNARNGRCRIAEAGGPLELDVTNVELAVVRPQGSVRIAGNGGKATIDDPRSATTLDVRRIEIDVTLARAIPLTVLAADAPLRLMLSGTPAIALDAVAIDGHIDAADFSLTPVTTNEESRLRHSFGNATTPVALRNQRSEIVIRRTK